MKTFLFKQVACYKYIYIRHRSGRVVLHCWSIWKPGRILVGWYLGLRYLQRITTNVHVLTTVVKKSSTFSDIRPCSPFKVHRPFWGTILNFFCLFTFGSCWIFSWNYKIEATCSSETSADFQRNIWPYIPRDRSLPEEYCHLECDVMQIWRFLPTFPIL